MLAYAVFPWLAAVMTCPDLHAALAYVSRGVLTETACFGFLWGVGSQLFGVGIALLGNSLGFALILGLVATVGSIVPLLALHTREAASTQGVWNFGSPPYAISSGNSDANGYGNFEYAVPSGYYALNTKNLAEFG